MKTKPAHTLFMDLVDEIYQMLGQKPPTIAPEAKADILEAKGVDFEMNGVSFSLLYSPVHSTDKFAILCRFGKLPEQDKAEALLRVLEVNYLLQFSDDTTFSVEPMTQHVVLGFKAVLGSTSAQAVLLGMAQAVERARDWQDSYFMDDRQELSSELSASLDAAV